MSPTPHPVTPQPAPPTLAPSRTRSRGLQRRPASRIRRSRPGRWTRRWAHRVALLTGAAAAGGAALAAASLPPSPGRASAGPVRPAPEEQLLDLVASVGRWFLVCAGAYLCLLAVVHLLSSFGGPRSWLRTVAGRLTPRVLSAVMAGTLMTVGPWGGSSVGAQSAEEAPPPEMQRVGPLPATNADEADEAESPTTLDSEIPDTSLAPTVIDLGPPPPSFTAADPTTTTTTATTPTPGPITPAWAPTQLFGPTHDSGPTHYTVQAGDHFWSIAEARVAARAGLDPAIDDVPDALIAPYWLDLVEENRHHLVDPDNPDLIHPGLVIVLPD